MKSARFTRRTEAEQLERTRTRVLESSDAACQIVADEICELIHRRQREDRFTVLGLATGSTPVPLYRELIRRHQEEGLSFAKVITFNLDEYYGLNPDHRESYARFMADQLFNHVDIPKDQIHIPDGTAPRDQVFGDCLSYEDAISEAGGIDIQILGIGRSGHIGFNEPGSTRDSRTRIVTLDSVTRHDAARDFLGYENVPRFAITMGVGTILEARRVILMAWGSGKARVIAQAVEGPKSESVTASFLQDHPNAIMLVDRAAGADLTRYRHPWLVGRMQWSRGETMRAVTWLARKVDKPILKLRDRDYSENGLSDLVTREGRSYDLNIRIFNELQHTITGWPGGKPEADDSNRPERASPHPKRVLVLSPEPQDDVLGMAGTINRLVSQGHDVRLVHMTSGSLGVPDGEARKVAGLLLDAGRSEEGWSGPTSYAEELLSELGRKAEEPFAEDDPRIRQVKGWIRQSEARMASRSCGLPDEAIAFLELGFYERGRYRQFQLGEDDVARVRALLEEHKPHQIFMTGKQADPSSVEFLCFEVLRRALVALEGAAWLSDCYLWLYRGAGRDWQSHEIEMAVPMSPGQLADKIKAIYQHQSQRSQTPSSEGELRESWQLAEARDQGVARLYDQLGLANYEAIETFRRWRPE